MSLIFLPIIPSLFGCIIVVMILTVLPGPYSRSTNFRRWTNLTSILIVISFRPKQQAWVRVRVVTVVPITSCFIIPLTWCRRWLTTSAWNLSTIVSWSSSTLWALPGIQLNSWWVIPCLPLMIPVLIDHFIAFRSTQLVRVLCKPWDHCYPAVDLPYLGSITISFCQECGENFTTS